MTSIRPKGRLNSFILAATPLIMLSFQIVLPHLKLHTRWHSTPHSFSLRKPGPTGTISSFSWLKIASLLGDALIMLHISRQWPRVSNKFNTLQCNCYCQIRTMGKAVQVQCLILMLLSSCCSIHGSFVHDTWTDLDLNEGQSPSVHQQLLQR